MEKIKNQKTQERQEYVAPSVKVIEVATQGILCASGEPSGTYPGNPW